MEYTYGGYLAGLLSPPSAEELEALESVEFGRDDFMRWHPSDMLHSREWQNTPVQRHLNEDGVRLQGRFEDLRQIDMLARDELAFWVPLSTIGLSDERLPVCVSRHPVAEVTYRCVTAGAHPAIVWLYKGGHRLDWLPAVQETTTVAFRIPHFGFPSHLTGIAFRVYSSTRTTESVLLQSIRFRGMTSAEEEVQTVSDLELKRSHEPPTHQRLDEFMPLGVYLSAATSKELARLLGVALDEYWDLVFEDVVKHHMNTIAVSDIGTLTPDEWRAMLQKAEERGLCLLASDTCSSGDRLSLEELLRDYAAPAAERPSLLGWELCDLGGEESLLGLLARKEAIEEADPGHPVTVTTHLPSTYPLVAPFFSASGIRHFVSHDPWEVGEVVEQHVNLARGQHFWVVAPTYISKTGSPEWSTCSEIRLTANLSIAHGAKGWFAYQYNNLPFWAGGENQRSLTGPFLTFSDVWSELGICLGRMEPLAPLLLNAKAQPATERWFVTRSVARENAQRPAGAPPTGTHHLSGPDYDIYFVVSNDAREMATLNIAIPPDALRGMEIYDLTDFIQKRKWNLMSFERHLEMFPGQARALLIAKPDVCAYYRDVIMARLMDGVLRTIAFNLNLARNYGLGVGRVETLIETARNRVSFDGLVTMDLAHDTLLNLVNESRVISDVRSKIIEANAAVCACDGALCRLVKQGRRELAAELGDEVMPLAREFTALRLELRRGQGTALYKQCDSLARRAVDLLARIRSHK